MRFRLRSDRLLWIASWLSVRARRRQRSCAYGLRQSCRAPQAARVWRNRHVHLACTTADASKSAGRRRDRTLPPGTRTPSFAGGCVVHGLAWRRSHGLNAQRFAGLRRTGRNPPHAKPGAVRIPTRGPVQGTGVYAWTELAFRIMPTMAQATQESRAAHARCPTALRKAMAMRDGDVAMASGLTSILGSSTADDPDHGSPAAPRPIRSPQPPFLRGWERGMAVCPRRAKEGHLKRHAKRRDTWLWPSPALRRRGAGAAPIESFRPQPGRIRQGSTPRCPMQAEPGPRLRLQGRFIQNVLRRLLHVANDGIQFALA